MASDDRLRPYVPGFVVDWLATTPSTSHRQVEGTLAFVDVSGFTRLTERLARRGKVGAEEMTGILDRTFAELLGVAYAHGAWLVKWGGDAVLLLFQGDAHAARAATAAVGMLRAMDVVGRVQTASGPVRLRVSIGLHSGMFDFFLVGSTHRELVIAGPGPSTTAAMEAAATGGQVVVSPDTAHLLPPRTVRARRDGALLVMHSPEVPPTSPVRATANRHVDVGVSLPAVTRDYLLSGDDDAEHRLVTVGFVEFTGVDRLLADQGPGTTTAAVDAVIRTCQESAVRHGVTFWETDISQDGGKVMLVAGVPTSSGSEEDAVLAVARDVVDADLVLSVRVGVNSGRVFFGQFGPPYRRTMSIKGDAVNLAARLMGKAAAGEVLAAVQVVAHARTPFSAEALPPFTVKGKTVLVHACRVGPVQDAVTANAVDDGVFIGRSSELARLHAQWLRARTGGLRICELVGEPGVGKSRLVRELLRTVDGRVLEIRADRYTATSAYAPFRRLLRGLLAVPDDATPEHAGELLLAAAAAHAPDLLPFTPLLAAVLDAQVPPTPAASAVDDRFRAQRQEEVAVDLIAALLPEPTALVLDDAHLLDAASVSMLRRLAQRATSSPWLVMVCRREETQARPLEGIDVTESTTLAALDPSASLSLVHALLESSPLPPHEVAVLVRRAGGNPLFLGELAAATASGARLDELPTTVEHVVAARIDALQRTDRALLRAAAVIGMDVRTATLHALADRAGLDLREDSLQRLSAFLEPVGDALRFRHALVQETAYEGLPYSRRKVLHGHVGDVLSALTGPEADAVLSLHFLRAERYDEGWRTARRAGDRARSMNAPGEAAELYARAVEAVRHAPEVATPETLATTYEALGDARSRLGQFASAIDAFGHARRSAAAGIPTARLLHKTAVATDRIGAYSQALRWIARGRAALVDVPDGAPREHLAAQLAVEHAVLRHWQGRQREAVLECRNAIDLAERAGADDVVADALMWLDAAEQSLGLGDGEPTRRALGIWQALGDRPWQEGRCLNHLGSRAYFAGRWNEARSCYAEARHALERAGDAWAASVTTGNEAEVLCDQGRLEEAEPLVREALRVWRASSAPSFVAFGLSLLGRLLARSGRPDEGVELLRQARALHVEDGEAGEVLEADARIAECLALAGRYTPALATAEDALLRAEQGEGLASQVPALHRTRAFALAAQGDRPASAAALVSSLAAARARGAQHETAFTLHAQVQLFGPGKQAEELAALLSALGIVRVPVPVTDRAVPPALAASAD